MAEPRWDRPREDAQPEPRLQAIRLSKRYRRGVWALRDVDIAIPPASITALVGPNGSGKTTLMRCLLDFESPTTGSVRVCGLDPARDRHAALMKLAYVSQEGALYRNLTARDNIDLAWSLRPSLDRASARDRVSAFGIDLGQKVGTLSGGQRAQVLLSIALATQAPVLLLDEPLASLDPLARRSFLASLAEDVRRRGTTVLMSSHIISDIEAVCDALIILASGRAVLHSRSVEAVQSHRIVPGSPPAGHEPIASFMGMDGEMVSLVPNGNGPGREPSLEEVVMGYLASAGSE